MRGAVAVSAHFLKQFYAVTLNSVKYRLALQTVVLVTAKTFDNNMLVIEEETVVGVKTDGSEAEMIGNLVNYISAADYRGFALVKIGVFAIPKLRRGDGHFLVKYSFIL